ncbi:MAG: WD40 repeat domain-containing protein, partial [Odoribacter sp.]|nr:WD40 repeat domain-containing protein [Odoribacter sp.]
MMKKGILLFAAVVLIGLVAYAVWYINRRGELTGNSKDSFIPNNSALVVSFNPGVSLSEKIRTAFAADIRSFREAPLYKAVDTLIAGNFAAPTSRILAVRLEGKRKPVFLWVMDNRDVLSRSEIVAFLKRVFQAPQEQFRKYDNYRIYSLNVRGEMLYYAVEEGMILISGSELYVEDALKQFEQQAEGKKANVHYENINKYFSAGAGMNVFLNTACFSELLPMFIQTGKMFPGMDITQCFKWGALDGDVSAEGVTFNGFMHYSGMNESYMKTLEEQRPKESSIENIIPVYSQSLLLLNLSDLKQYLAALDNYRYDSGKIEKIRKRKQECARLLGKNAEAELKELLQGEFARPVTTPL